MTGVPAVTLPQPLPTLVAEGVVTALSMAKPAPAGLVGGRLLIHAGTKAPTGAEQQDVGDWQVQPDGAGGWSMRHLPTSREAGRGQNLLSTLFPAQLGHEYGYRALPLGAIVASATLTACLPIVDAYADVWPTADVVAREAAGLGLHSVNPRGWGDGGPCWDHEDISDQLPYGDFAPGCFAWLLDDVQPTTARCPWCDGLGLVADGPFDAGCPACAGAGRCDPIPARGRPGVWRWRRREDQASPSASSTS